MYAVCYGKWMSRRHYSRCWTFKGVSLKWNRLIRRNMKHALRYARRVNGLIKVLAENVVLMWKREPFGQMHIARWGQTCGDHQIRSLYHISISLFIKLANPLFQSLFACFTSLFATLMPKRSHSDQSSARYRYRQMTDSYVQFCLRAH